MSALVTQLGQIIGRLAAVVLYPGYLAVSWLARATTRVVLYPFFGISGTDFLQGTRGRKGLVDWIGYDCRTLLMVVQMTKGKTVFTYRVHDVFPWQYLWFRRDPTNPRLHSLFLADNTRTYESVWRWRWDGAHGRKVRW